VEDDTGAQFRGDPLRNGRHVPLDREVEVQGISIQHQVAHGAADEEEAQTGIARCRFARGERVAMQRSKARLQAI
jgi:hypothetical protein